MSACKSIRGESNHGCRLKKPRPSHAVTPSSERMTPHHRNCAQRNLECISPCQLASFPLNIGDDSRTQADIHSRISQRTIRPVPPVLQVRLVILKFLTQHNGSQSCPSDEGTGDLC